MAVIVLKYTISGGIAPEKELIKLFKNESSCDRFVKQVANGIGENGITVISKTVDNRAPRTIKRLMGIPKRKVR